MVRAHYVIPVVLVKFPSFLDVFWTLRHMHPYDINMLCFKIYGKVTPINTVVLSTGVYFNGAFTMEIHKNI